MFFLSTELADLRTSGPGSESFTTKYLGHGLWATKHCGGPPSGPSFRSITCVKPQCSLVLLEMQPVGSGHPQQVPGGRGDPAYCSEHCQFHFRSLPRLLLEACLGLLGWLSRGGGGSVASSSSGPCDPSRSHLSLFSKLQDSCSNPGCRLRTVARGVWADLRVYIGGYPPCGTGLGSGAFL